ncbi:MAG: universal stress protein [Deltaproteobacteria bacterium]|nr:universal stress protein [Deltaproteobacteria bacterium]
MAHKVLIALDSSPGAWGAVEYVAEAFGHTPGVQVTLLQVLSGLPPAFWDDGHILDEKEKGSRQQLVAAWQKEQEHKWQALVKKAHERLAKAGVAKDAVVNKFQPKDYDVAEDILSAAAAGNFNTIVMGRRGLGRAKTLVLGSVTNKVMQGAKGRAVTIIG